MRRPFCGLRMLIDRPPMISIRLARRTLVPFRHLQPAARVQFGQGVIHVSPCEGGPFPWTFPGVETWVETRAESRSPFGTKAVRKSSVVLAPSGLSPFPDY